MTPAPRRAVEGWLAELSCITARRKTDDFEAAVTVAAYANRLEPYPADVVCEALIVTVWHYWPTWAELNRRAAATRSSVRVGI